MGEGGILALLNGTQYVWRRTEQSNYQMESWGFPETIQPGQAIQNYVEYKQSIFTTRTDTIGKLTYKLEGTNSYFYIEARDSPSKIQVCFNGIETLNNARGSWLNLGWRHDGSVYFVLSGKEGSYRSSNPPINWMQRSLPIIGNRNLSQICMPGTHDSGMGKITWADHIPEAIISDFTQTQSTTILGQLYYGARYFDIRPEISSGEYWTGHYDQGSHMGARGQKISEIITEVNLFTMQFGELIILNLSHAMQTDDNFRDFNQDDWNRLMNELKGLNHRYIVTDKAKANDLSLLKMNEFIDNNRAAVICVVEAPASIKLGDYANQGFYTPSQLNVENDYANTNDNVRMKTDQLQKMRNHMGRDDKRLFLLSWTLTQQMPSSFSLENIAILAATLKSIRTMAYSANKSAMTELLPEIGPKSFPNVFYIDYIEGSDYTALAMAINDRGFQG